MIKIDARNNGDEVKLVISVSGKRGDIIEEFSSIMIHLPRELAEADPNVFQAATDKFKERVEEIITSGATDEIIVDELKEVSNATKQN